MLTEKTVTNEVNMVKAYHMDQLAEFHKKLYKEPILRLLFLELTLRCNEHCFHCGSRCSSTAIDGMPIEKYLEVLKDVKENIPGKLPQICLTGGEPMLRQDLFELMSRGMELGFRYGMTSNGTLITPEKARLLRINGLRTISISIDGLPETHDRQRGLSGAYRMAVEGIENLLTEGGFKAVQVTTVLNHGNIHELPELYRIFEKMDIDSWRVVGLEPIGRALDNPEMMLTPEDTRYMLDFIREKRLAEMPVSYGCSHFLGLGYEREVRDWYFLCNAGIYAASVMADGSVGACLDIERCDKTIQGNVWQTPFSELWKKRFDIFRAPLSERNETCRTCSYEKWCAGGAHHSWDYEKEQQRICYKDVLFN